MGDDDLTRVEGKLNAILAILVDRHIRETEIARPKDRSIDKMLTDAGLNAKDIARLLGKTERGVNMQLQREAQRKGTRRSSTTKQAGKSTE